MPQQHVVHAVCATGCCASYTSTVSLQPYIHRVLCFLHLNSFIAAIYLQGVVLLAPQLFQCIHISTGCCASCTSTVSVHPYIYRMLCFLHLNFFIAAIYLQGVVFHVPQLFQCSHISTGCCASCTSTVSVHPYIYRMLCFLHLNFFIAAIYLQGVVFHVPQLFQCSNVSNRVFCIIKLNCFNAAVLS